MIKKLADFFRNPIVYRALILGIVGFIVFMEFIGPLMGMWKPHSPTMLHGWIMMGK